LVYWGGLWGKPKNNEISGSDWVPFSLVWGEKIDDFFGCCVLLEGNFSGKILVPSLVIVSLKKQTEPKVHKEGKGPELGMWSYNKRGGTKKGRGTKVIAWGQGIHFKKREKLHT